MTLVHACMQMGGIMWFCIPFTLATTMGLSALALDLPITLAESGSGKTMPPLPHARVHVCSCAIASPGQHAWQPC